jgi:UDP-N-acetylmuramate--alanine ligase
LPASAFPYASAIVGEGPVFVSELDESDGSIALYRPRVAAVNNISLDHKSMDELRLLFRDFAGKAQTVVLNLDNAETAALAGALPPRRVMTYSLRDSRADLLASSPVPSPVGIAFDVTVRDTGETVPVTLKVPGLHNVSNALAALSVAEACGVAVAEAAAHLSEFAGIRRRLDVVGADGGITVIDTSPTTPTRSRPRSTPCTHFPAACCCCSSRTATARSA